MFRWWKWARRDRRLAWFMIIDLVLGVLLVVTLVSVLSPASNRTNSGIVTVTPAISPTEESFDLIVAPTPTPLPTVNPTSLLALPNQGQSSAPAPPGLVATPSPNSTVGPTPTPTVRQT